VSLASLEALLLVQERDTALDRLRHRRANLPERAELAAKRAALETRAAERAELQRERDGVHAEERRLDDEARSVGAHAEEVDKKLYSGTVVSPRELQAMQADLEMLRRRRSEIEDQELEVMEQRENLDAQIEVLDAAIAELNGAVATLETTIADAEREIDEEAATEAAARRDAAAPVDEGLLRDYEKRRTQNRGAGAARLVGATCQACHLTIPSTEAERIRRAAGEVVAYCDNCSAILVP
jgi:uncharacterized protein